MATRQTGSRAWELAPQLTCSLSITLQACVHVLSRRPSQLLFEAVTVEDVAFAAKAELWESFGVYISVSGSLFCFKGASPALF